jgi:ATP-dependent helicase HrpB
VLPIDLVIPEILDKLRESERLVVQAPPGAGKTTRLPLALLDQPWLTGRVLLIQPRRLAVYGAARRLASQLGEPVGQTIGYRTRFDSKTSAHTRIEVITEGIFLRLVQQDPELSGVALVMFDEFHERAVTIDLGLAFALDTQSALRDSTQPLRIVVMSATLDGDRLSRWLDAPWVASEGRMFPVVTRYQPLPAGEWPERHCASVIRQMLSMEEGSVLVFLPGFREIRRVQQTLEDTGLPSDVQVHVLHASLPPETQEAAIAPAPAGARKVVLATNVAETSVTIEGIRVVVDSGMVRVSVFDERRGMDSLMTERISQASAEQRRGRAGRLSPGVCVRLWGESEHASLRPFTEPEMLHCDLVPVALEMALWGVSDASALQLATPPPAEALTRARQTLQALEALDGQERMTALGREMAGLPLNPRLARLVWTQRQGPAAAQAMATAAVLTEGDPLQGDARQQSDLYLRLALWENGPRGHDVQRGTWQRLLQTVCQLSARIGNGNGKRLRDSSSDSNGAGLPAALVAAFPDRVALCRPEGKLRYLLANGRGVQLAREDRLAGSPLLVVLDMDGAGAEPRVTLACPVSRADLDRALGDRLQRFASCVWNPVRQAVEAEQQVRLGSLVLERRPLPQPWPLEARETLFNALRQAELSFLPWDDTTRAWQARQQWLQQREPDQWPAVDDATLAQTLDDWLAPFLTTQYSASALRQIDLLAALKSLLPWDRQTQAERQAPARWSLPTGETRELDYAAVNGPVLRGRMQEFFGLAVHPTLPSGERLLVEILSPAHRPIQVTRDLPGFWKGSYKEVAKEMRGRYPKHFWPEDPQDARATTRTKRNMT